MAFKCSTITAELEQQIWKVEVNASHCVHFGSVGEDNRCPTKTKRDKTRTQKKGGDNSSGGHNPNNNNNNKTITNTHKKGGGGGNARGHNPPKKGEIIQGQTTQPKKGEEKTFRGDHSSWLILRSTLSYPPGNRLSFLPLYYFRLFFTCSVEFHRQLIKLQNNKANIRYDHDI